MKSKKIPLIIIGGFFFSIMVIFILLSLFNHFFPEQAFSLDLFGKVPLCNRKIERAIIIHGFVFPLCIRCTSMVFSYLVAICILLLPKINKQCLKWNRFILFVLSILLILPLIIDGVKVYFFQIDSPNYIRVFTGILFGSGGALLTKLIILKIFD